MELKDIITPLVTLAAVWMTARFTLRNEVQKKALEIRTARLETLSTKCSRSLQNVAHYLRSLAFLLEGQCLIMDDRRLSASGTGIAFAAETLTDLKKQLDESEARLNAELLERCRDLLRFHHPRQYIAWENHVITPQISLMAFFYETLPGEAPIDMRGRGRSVDEALTLAQQLRQQASDALLYSQQLTQALAGEYRALTGPADGMTLRDHLKNFLKWLRYFLS